MLTPNQIKNVMFTKSAVGGYKMSEVDEFILVVCNDYSRLYKENSELQLNVETLDEKVKEYSANEDNIKTTLVTAQKMADKIVGEAKAERERIKESTTRDFGNIVDAAKREAKEMVEDATRKSKEILDEAKILSDTLLEDTNEQVAHQQKVLESLKQEISDFREKILGMYEAQIASVKDLPALEKKIKTDMEEQKAARNNRMSYSKSKKTKGQSEQQPAENNNVPPAVEDNNVKPAEGAKVSTPILNNITDFLNKNFSEEQGKIEVPIPETIRDEVEKQEKAKASEENKEEKEAKPAAETKKAQEDNASVTQKGKMGVLKFGGKGKDDYDIFDGDDD